MNIDLRDLSSYQSRYSIYKYHCYKKVAENNSVIGLNNERTTYVFTFQPGKKESESSEFRIRMKELLVIFLDTLTVALTATIQINAQNIHA